MQREDLHSGAGDGVEDVGNRAAAGEVVDGCREPCHDGTQCCSASGLLYRLQEALGFSKIVKMVRWLLDDLQHSL